MNLTSADQIIELTDSGFFPAELTAYDDHLLHSFYIRPESELTCGSDVFGIRISNGTIAAKYVYKLGRVISVHGSVKEAADFRTNNAIGSSILKITEDKCVLIAWSGAAWDVRDLPGLTTGLLAILGSRLK